MRKLCVVLLFLVSIQPAFSQDTTAGMPTTSASFKAAFFSQLDDVEKKILDLAGAMPAEKYSWRPMEGVRSVSEVYMHIAGTNYFIPTFIGVKSSEGSEGDLEKKITEKAKVVEMLQKSFAHVRQGIEGIPDADLTKPAKFFGQKTTVLGVILNIAVHMHEHLGQSIAYARMNQVVPPWTAAEEAKAKEKASKKE